MGGSVPQSWTKLVETNIPSTFFARFLTCRQVKGILSPSPPTQCCFMGFAVRQALFARHDSIDNIEMGGGVIPVLGGGYLAKCFNSFVQDCSSNFYNQRSKTILVPRATHPSLSRLLYTFGGVSCLSDIACPD